MVEPVTICAAVTGVVKVGLYMGARGMIKKQDGRIRIEAERERLAESQEEGPKDLHNHPLHAHHPPLVFYQGATATPFSCGVCTQDGTGSQYNCKSCDFVSHLACAVSDDIIKGLISEKTKHNELVHEHPLSLIIESGGYDCFFCFNKSKTKCRYHCETCKCKYDLMCVNHPTRLSSFLHPQHELELKIRHHFKNCAVCGHGRGSNARVYTCEQCDFCVHPVCAMRSQYTKHPSHEDHTLVFAAVPSVTKVSCVTCKKKCKRWCYLCPICEGVYFHPECIGLSSTSTASLEGYGEEFALAGDVVDGVGTTAEIAHGIAQAMASVPLG